MYDTGDTAYYGSYKVEVVEDEPGLQRALVEVKKSDVDWTGYVSYHLLTDGKDNRDDYPWPTNE